MGWIISKLVGLGLGGDMAKTLAPILLVVAVCSIVAPASYVKGRMDGSANARAEYAEAALQSQIDNVGDLGVSAAESEIGQDRIDQQEEDAINAIRNSGDRNTVPSSSSNALNCRRMRDAGQDTASIPECQ